ncbi:MAG: AsmA-like C-terminal domain-containing protein [Pseudomonadota bacterium]
MQALLKQIGERGGGPRDKRRGLFTICASGCAKALSASAAFGLSALMMLGFGLVVTGMPGGSLITVVGAAAEYQAGMELSAEEARLRLTSKGIKVEADAVHARSETQAIDADGILAELRLKGLFSAATRVERMRIDRVNAVTQPGSGGGPALPIDSILATLSSGAAGLVDILDVTVSFFSAADADPVVLDRGWLKAGPQADGYIIDSNLPFLLGEETGLARLDVLTATSGFTDLSFTAEGAPLGPLLTLMGVDAMDLSGALDGDVTLKLDGEGNPIAGALDIVASPGEGYLATNPFGFGENRLRARFVDGEPKFEIMELLIDVAGNRGLVTGEVRAENLLRPQSLKLAFNAVAEDIHVDFGSFLEGPLDISVAEAIGTFDAEARHLDLVQLSSAFFRSRLKGSLSLTFPEGFIGNPRIVADASTPGPLSPQEVLAGWPVPVAGSARRWVARNLSAGDITNVRYTADIPMGAVKPQTPLDDDVMLFTFDASNATVAYRSTMPPITKLKASAIVRGNSFDIDAESGEVAGIDVEGGTVRIPRFLPGGAISTFNGQLAGEVPVVLAALEESGLAQLSDGAFPPESFRGRGSFDLTVTWPMRTSPRPEDVIITGTGAFAQGVIDDILPGVDFVGAGGGIRLTEEDLLIAGDGLVATAPTEFRWLKHLDGDERTELSAAAELDHVAADLVGVPLREFLDGTAMTTITAWDLKPGKPLVVEADIINTALEVKELGLFKPAGLPGTIVTSVRLPGEAGDDRIELSDIIVKTPSVEIEGSGLFTEEGGLLRLDLPRYVINQQSDMSVRINSEGERLKIELVGERADASGFLETLLTSGGDGGEEGEGGLPGAASLAVDVERMYLRNGVTLNNLVATALHDGKSIEALTLNSRLADGGPFTAVIGRAPGEPLGNVDMDVADFGQLMSGIFGVTSIRGGEGTVRGTTIEAGGFRGRLEVGEFVVKDAPIMARLLAVGSLDGLNDVLGGEGIRFNQLDGDVWIHDGQVGLSDAKMVGSSLGISATGMIDLVEGQIDVRGAIAPAYSVNKILGTLPGIGQLFVSRDGEGVVAFSYQIVGTIDQPTVTVNGLSALTPGILRRMFEPLAFRSAETRDLLDAAIIAAEEENEDAEAEVPDEAPQN